MVHKFSSAVNMIIEKDAVSNNKELISSLGSKALIVTGKNSAVKTGALSDVKEALDSTGIQYEIYSEIEPNPTYNSVLEASEKGTKASCDFVIGIGGGSPLDAAKAIAAVMKNPGITEDEAFSAIYKNGAYPIVAIGTTAGTGSEVTPYAVITGNDGRKKSMRSVHLLPKVSLGDITYISKMNDTLIKNTALDACCHAFESYFCRVANDFTKTFAIRAIKLLIPEFETISAYGTEGLDDEDFENLYLASIYAGYAISVTGTAMCHTLSYYLSENKDIPHGRACALYLPAFILHNIKWAPKESADLYDEILRTDEEIRTLVTDLTGVCDLKLTKEDLDTIRPRLENNPSLEKCLGECSPAYAEEILKALFS
ncbi:MAG: iron-containing alcohol dehydrogenase [Clostridia bacterium]|nr:iron-containing alcohol dehydrogenase [Clostridia bacterium]